MQRLRHSEKWRDANAAGDKDRSLSVTAERKIIARLRNRQHVAFADSLVQALRAAAGRRLAFDADNVASGFAGTVDDRILPHLAVRQMYVDMRAGLESRQMAA